MIRRLLQALACALLLAAPAALAFDIDRAFRNYDRLIAGEIGAADLSESERAEIMVLQNTFDYLDRGASEPALGWADCDSLKTLGDQQARQLGNAASRLASCARRNDYSRMLSAASRLVTCASGGGIVDDCSRAALNTESLRDQARECTNDLRRSSREQRTLVTIRLHEENRCLAPVPPEQ